MKRVESFPAAFVCVLVIDCVGGAVLWVVVCWICSICSICMSSCLVRCIWFCCSILQSSMRVWRSVSVLCFCSLLFSLVVGYLVWSLLKNVHPNWSVAYYAILADPNQQRKKR